MYSSSTMVTGIANPNFFRLFGILFRRLVRLSVKLKVRALLSTPRMPPLQPTDMSQCYLHIVPKLMQVALVLAAATRSPGGRERRDVRKGRLNSLGKRGIFFVLF